MAKIHLFFVVHKLVDHKLVNRSIKPLFLSTRCDILRVVKGSKKGEKGSKKEKLIT